MFSVAIADLIQLCRDHRQFGSFLRVLAIDQLARAYEKETAMEPTAAIPRDAYGTSEALAGNVNPSRPGQSSASMTRRPSTVCS